jgi:hypothetical protein
MPDPITVRLPPQDELARLWHKIEPLLAKATARSRCYEPIDVLRLTMAVHLPIEQRMMIWTVERGGEIVAVLVSKVTQYPRRRILEMLFAGGSRMREWLPIAIPLFDQCARETGCDSIASVGRKGWARAWGGVAVDTVCVREL